MLQLLNVITIYIHKDVTPKGCIHSKCQIAKLQSLMNVTNLILI